VGCWLRALESPLLRWNAAGADLGIILSVGVTAIWAYRRPVSDGGCEADSSCVCAGDVSGDAAPGSRCESARDMAWHSGGNPIRQFHSKTS
jgi:hypothetical protein